MQVQSPSALDLRCQMALARAIWANDYYGSARIAYDTFRLFIQSIQGEVDPASPVAWPIKTDPVLSVAYQKGIRLLTRRNALCKQLKIARANADLRKGARVLAMEQRMLEEPSAQTLLQQLQMHKVVELNQHTLIYDSDFRGLAGTNPFGIDYYAGNMTLECVEQWRTAMMEGQTWGASPVPEWDNSGESSEDHEIMELRLSIEWVDDQFADLANMKAISFAPGFSGLICAQTKNPISTAY